MKLKQGDLWKDSAATVKLFTANSTLNRNGSLVMGRGAAAEAKRLFPHCDRAFGSLIRGGGYADGHNFIKPYGILIHPDRHSPILAAFQVKYHYADRAEMDLIGYSAAFLEKYLNRDWREHQVAMNFPGIGYGGLQRDAVLPIIQRLPDNLEIWEYPG